MRKQSFVALAVASAVGLGLAGASVVSAHGVNAGVALRGAMPFSRMIGGEELDPSAYADRLQAQFAREAKLLGVTEAEVKAAWAEGKGLMELAEQKGITKEDLAARIKAEAESQMKAQMDALVAKGIITRVQADARLAAMAKQEANFMVMKGDKGDGKMRVKRLMAAPGGLPAQQ
jgi:hypothetical protein